MIRNALKKASESNKKLGKNGNQSDMESLEKEMQKTENDLVNKKIDPATIGRQKDILTRLLEAEKTTKERELDNKREAKTSSNMPVEYPANLQKYLSQKSNQIELLKTISPQLNPYYKEQVNEYFHKIEN